MLKIAIVDDAKDICIQIKERVEKILFPTAKDYRIHMFENGAELLNIIDKERMDILLLDIDMPDLNGLQVAEQLRLHKQMPIIIYITSEVYYMPEAFGVNVFSFIDKQKLDEHLESTILRCIHYIEQNISVSFKTNQGYVQLKKDEIIYFSYVGRKICAQTIFDSFEIHAETLSSIHHKLHDDAFIFLNRGILVNIRYIKSTKHGIAKLDGVKEEIAISQNKIKAINEQILTYLSMSW